MANACTLASHACFSIDFERAPKYQRGLNCGHGLRRITSIAKPRGGYNLATFAISILSCSSVHRARACVRTCVRERVCALSHARARVWVTLRARAPHARQILRSRDESIGEINLMASYLATESETTQA